MAKRKRDIDSQQSPSVGLGATLAHLRGEDQPSPTHEDDEGGWTVVESKRRRKEREPSTSVEPGATATRPLFHEETAYEAVAVDKHASNLPPPPASDVPPPNPFRLAKDSSDREARSDNPFLALGNGTEDGTMSREERRKERKLDRHYPAIEHSHHNRLQSHVKLLDLQTLILYLLADGTAPQWVSVRNRSSIQKVVVLMVPGLDMNLFNGKVTLDSTSSAVMPEAQDQAEAEENSSAHNEENAEPKFLNLSSDDPYPARLKPSRLANALQPLADIFEHVWPTKAPGEHRANQYSRLHSPIHTMLTSQIPRTQEEKQMKKKGQHKGPVPQNSKHWDNKRTPITQFLMNLTDQQENEYIAHPAMFTSAESKAAALKHREDDSKSIEHGWVDTRVDDFDDGQVPEGEIEQGSVTAGRQVISVDCEMCKAENDEFVLTRVSLLTWDGQTLLDKLVKPDLAIKDYLTQWSGITQAMLEDVTTTLADIQKELLEIVTPQTILVGHSLNSDLNALKMTHPYLVDTGVLYPHPRGPPYKQSLKWLAQKYLHREVQKGTKGHDSVEDARTCLDLVKQKCEKGPAWGSGDTNAESLFKRLGRSPRPKSNNDFRTGAVVDWGEPKRGHGGQAHASIGCKSDDEVVAGVIRATTGVAVGQDGSAINIDLTWARLRELELCRGWWDDSKTADVEAIRQSALQRLGLSQDDSEADLELSGSQLSEAVSRTIARISQIHESLPRCTALVVYSGTGDPRAMRRLQAMQQQYRREYQTKNWDSLSVKWTDTEIQALNKACQDARNGIAFIGVK